MKLQELFEINYGSNIELSNTEEVDQEIGYPFVSRTEKNNGVSAYVTKQPASVKINPAHTLSVAMGGSVLETFYQGREYYSGRDIAYLKPRIDMTKEEMIYYALCIKQNKVKYSYGRQANRTLKDLEIPEYSSVPSWINNHRHQEIEYTKSDEISINQNDCEDVYLFDLFIIERGKSKSLCDLISDDGLFPVVSSTNGNNGISAYTNEEPKYTDVPCLTIAINGSIGSCFLQKEAFHATADVAILKPKFDLNKYNAVYISALLRKEGRLKYSYGRKWSVDALKNTSLKLPTKDGNVDWTLISSYIENIEKRYKISSTKTIKP